jgi:hypothetical protein
MSLQEDFQNLFKKYYLSITFVLLSLVFLFQFIYYKLRGDQELSARKWNGC